MSKTFKQMYENVGTDIQDTSTDMATIIKRYINRRQAQIVRAINFDIINDDYTFNTVAGTSSYELPDDFKTEIACIDTTNGVALSRQEFAWFQRNNPAGLSSQGSVGNYIIFTDDAGAKKIRLIYIPTSVLVIALPYIVNPENLSDDDDTPIFEIDDLLEVGATADAWRYKRQMAKAQQYEMMFNSMFADFIWSQENNPIQPKQFTPTTFNQSGLY